MLPHLPTDDAKRPKPGKLNSRVWLLLLLAILVVVVVAWLLPKKAVDSQKAPQPAPVERPARAQTEGYKNPKP